MAPRDHQCQTSTALAEQSVHAWERSEVHCTRLALEPRDPARAQGQMAWGYAQGIIDSTAPSHCLRFSGRILRATAFGLAGESSEPLPSAWRENPLRGIVSKHNELQRMDTHDRTHSVASAQKGRSAYTAQNQSTLLDCITSRHHSALDCIATSKRGPARALIVVRRACRPHTPWRTRCASSSAWSPLSISIPYVSYNSYHATLSLRAKHWLRGGPALRCQKPKSRQITGDRSERVEVEWKLWRRSNLESEVAISPASPLR